MKKSIFRLFSFVLSLLFFSNLHAQEAVSITASATVLEISEIELVTIKEMNVDGSFAENGIVNISPVTDMNAGELLVKGRANAQMRITSPNQTVLVNTSGQGTLIFYYVLSGFWSDNKQASEILNAPDRILQFNEEGQYYLWVGGRVDINNARPGNYEGEFILEIEYI
ncbi:MAG: DUF4402 domain-containing protein [Bacteroidales bacterium]|nr:DUF4402 domain-containing protein [Bacteroidales bacterium]